jgi:hypothetical protein
VFIPAVKYDKEQIERGIAKVEQKFPNDIVRIRYSVGEDWSEAPALFLRVLLTDNINLIDYLRLPYRRAEVLAIQSALTAALRSEIDTDDLQLYFAFRSVSEQEKLRDPEWD